MGLKSRVWPVVEVLLRVPPIFVMDAILSPDQVWNKSYGKSADESSTSCLWYLIYSTVFLVAFCLSLFSVELLMTVYLWLTLLGLMTCSYIKNIIYMSQIDKTSQKILDYNQDQNVEYFINNCLGQCLLMFAFYIIYKRKNNNVPITVIAMSFLGPSLLGYLNFPGFLLSSLPALCIIIMCSYILYQFFGHGTMLCEKIYDCVMKWHTVVQHYGIYNLLEHHWERLHIPKVLRIFWIIRLIQHAVIHISNMECIEWVAVLEIFKKLLISGCDTTIAILGMASVVSLLCCYFSHIIQTVLHIEDVEDRNIGTVSAVLFLILALQTGLTGLRPEKRLLRLYHNVCLLFTAFFHFVHNTVNPLLLSLSSTKSASVNKHLRALMVCSSLVFFPCWLIMYLWNQQLVSTWLLAITVFSVEVVVKAVITLLLYTLFLIDTHSSELWEELDTYIYYIRAAGNAIEFFFSIILFLNGGWMLIFESGGTIRACMICFHAYFNIWLQAKAGWNIVMKRKTAMKKINALPEATNQQLEKYDDVCAICYQQMKAARITVCNHYYHSVCLWKWLYVQDLCPLCQTCLYTMTELQERGYTGREAELDFNLIEWDEED